MGAKLHDQAVRNKSFTVQCFCWEVDFLANSLAGDQWANAMADVTVTVGILAAIGCVLILWLLTGSLWNLFQGVKAHLLPYFQPSSVDLTKKFGSWAGLYIYLCHMSVRRLSWMKVQHRLEFRGRCSKYLFLFYLGIALLIQTQGNWVTSAILTP